MKKQKRMPISKFKQLHIEGLVGRQQQATLTSRRFGIPRNLLLAATSESMIEAWRSGKPDVLARRDGSKLTAPVNGNGTAELRELLKAIGTTLEAHVTGKATMNERTARQMVKNITQALQGR
jgi:hypothetical protein